jgi:hypothetical protein
MKIYAQLTLPEMDAVARMPPTKEESVTTFYSEEGIYEVRGKLYKVAVVDEAAYEVECQGRAFQVDPSAFASSEAWQIPVPHTADRKTVLTHHLPGGLALISEKRPRGTTYFFTGGSVAQAAEWLKSLK